MHINNELTGILKTHIRSKCVSHAYIFNNIAQADLVSVADDFARRLLCLTPLNGEPCNECISCKMIQAGTHPDYIKVGTTDDIEMEDVAKEIDIGRIRILLQKLNEKPLYSSGKLCYINRADRMNIHAQNCLLKAFEEPPVGSVIVLETTNKHMLLDTLRSRAVIIDNGCDILNYINVRQMDQIDRKLEKIANKIALSLLSLAESSGKESVALYKEFERYKDEKNDLNMILEIISMLYRDIMVYNLTENEELLIYKDKKDFIIANASKYRPDIAANAIILLEQTRSELNKQYNYQLVIDSLLMKFADKEIELK